uniref:Ig-like domain-containing protein n=1 Tax=Cebus imitator TaxID=2715852 RepID=A0A2K5Q8P3_CEBIM
MGGPILPSQCTVLILTDALSCLPASLLTFWNPPTSAQLTIESVPSNAAEGKDVLLLTHNLPQNINGFNWYKGQGVDGTRRIIGYVVATQLTTPGPAHSGRETIYPNASLLIQNVTLNDTGFYTLQVIKVDLVNEEATGQFRVYHGPDAPTIFPLDTSYRSGENLNLSCHAASNPPAEYSWLVNGTSLQINTQELLIRNITVDHSGSYMCYAQNSATGLNRTTVKIITVESIWFSEKSQEESFYPSLCPMGTSKSQILSRTSSICLYTLFPLFWFLMADPGRLPHP